MARRTKAATAAGQPPSADPTEFVGRNDRGQVRPADDRYLSDAELDERDRYLLEVTGPEAQQLVHKRETLRVLLDQVDGDNLARLVEQNQDLEGYLEATDLRGALEAAATTMPNAEYRSLTADLEDVLDVQRQEKAAEDVSAEEGEQP